MTTSVEVSPFLPWICSILGTSNTFAMLIDFFSRTTTSPGFLFGEEVGVGVYCVFLVSLLFELRTASNIALISKIIKRNADIMQTYTEGWF